MKTKNYSWIGNVAIVIVLIIIAWMVYPACNRNHKCTLYPTPKQDTAQFSIPQHHY